MHCNIKAHSHQDGRRRPSTDVYDRPRRVDHPMASDVVVRDKVMNIQFIKWRTKPLSKLLLGKETLCMPMTCRVLTNGIEIMTKKVRAEQEGLRCSC